MTPNQIQELVEREYPGLVCKKRRSPDGWSFFKGVVRTSTNSTRIARVVQARPGAPVKFKPAVSARLQDDKRLEVVITGGADEVRKLLDREIALFDENFAQ